MEKTNIPELDKLFLDVGTYRKSTDFHELIKFIKKFPRIAPYNAMLIHIQKPGSSYVASTNDWKKKFNRTIKPGARPLVILRPFGPVAFLFELSDTEGEEPFPEELLNPFTVEGKLPESIFNNLVENLKCDGISYSEVELGSSRAGSIQTDGSNKRAKMIQSQKEIKLKILFNIIVNRNHPIETRFATIIHELGHLYCGHLGTPDPKMWKDRTNLEINQEEFEAESVCWMVCERLGIKNPSAEYLSGYLNENEFIPDISVDTVLKSVAMIESLLHNAKTPRKELVLRTRKLHEQQSFDL
jgi:hypothetical protein